MNLHIIKDCIGVYTPTILFFTSALLLRNQLKYLYIFTSGYFLNFILNVLLKLFIKEPRPSNDKKHLEIGVHNGLRVGFDKYGMPSGHAQICGYCLTFITLVLNNPTVTGLYLILTTNTLLQRYFYNNHTALQLTIGFIVGTSVGYLMYSIGNKYIKGSIRAKKDDNGPL